MDEADTDREDVETLAALTTAWQTYTAWRDEAVLGQLDRGERTAALAAYRADGPRMGTMVDERIDAFLVKKREVGATLEASAQASFDLTRSIAIVLSVAAAGLGLVIGFFLSRSFAGAVRQVAKAARGLATGDLNQHITLESKDEIGQMAEAVRDMIAYQQEMAQVADAMARSDLTQNVRPKGATDRLGNAFQRMIGNLRTLVGELEHAVRRANQLAELAEEREARMRAVLDSVADAIITFDEHGRIETLNPTAERVFDYAADELIGKDVAILLGEEPEGALDIGTRVELAGRRRDGTTFPMDLAVSEMRLAGRRLSIASIRDITERKQADARFRALLESAPDAIVTVNPEGQIAPVNSASVPWMDFCSGGAPRNSSLCESFLRKNRRQLDIQQAERHRSADSPAPGFQYVARAARCKRGAVATVCADLARRGHVAFSVVFLGQLACGGAASIGGGTERRTR